MPDRKKVIKGLEICSYPGNCRSECPYYEKEVAECSYWLLKDALELLKGQTVSGWVSVKDRLPEDAKDVLINIVGLMPKIGCYLSTGWFEAVLGYEYESGYKVTHWMPLPEPPEEVLNGNEH